MSPLPQAQMRALFVEWYEGSIPTIRFFSAAELLSTCQNVKHGVHNSVPPIHHWAKILPTVQLLDRLRKELGYPIHLNSIYRNPAYNAAIDGSKDSMHMYFNAMDFQGSRGTPREWRDALVMLEKNDGWRIGGLKAYPNFVHLDTRHNLGRKVWIA